MVWTYMNKAANLVHDILATIYDFGLDSYLGLIMVHACKYIAMIYMMLYIPAGSS